MSVTKDSNVAAMACVKYKVAFRHAQWAISVDQCISCLFFLLPRCMECRRGLAMRKLSARPSVRPSVCLSNAWVYDKTEERSVQIFYTIRKIIQLVF